MMKLSTKDNPGTLPVNLYENPGVAPKLLNMNSFDSIEQLTNAAAAADESVLFRANDFVCIKNRRLQVCQLRQSVKIVDGDTNRLTPRNAKVLHYKRDPFLPNRFNERDEGYVKTKDILCVIEEIAAM